MKRPSLTVSLALLVAALATTFVYISARSFFVLPAKAVSVEQATIAPTTETVAPVIASAQERERLDSELVTLKPAGFEPAELSRTGGHFVLAVDNQSGLEGLTLRLMREDGAREREVRFGRRLRWRERVNLPPGNYMLTVAGHPAWACRITIN